MRSTRLLFLCLPFLAYGCFQGITLDTPLSFSPLDWGQYGGSPKREHRTNEELTLPLELYWDQTTTGAVGAATPLVSNGSIYVTSIVGGLDVFDVLTGDRRGDIPIKASVHGTPAAIGNFLIIPLANNEPSLICIDGETNSLKWQKDMMAVEAPLLAVNGTVIAASLDGGVRCIRIVDSLDLWSITLPKPVYAAPASDDSTLYVGCGNGDLYALSLADGHRRWRVSTGAPVMAAPVLTGGAVTVTNMAGDVFCLARESGAQKWRMSVGAAIYGGLSADDVSVFIPVSNGTLVACSLRDGSVRWSRPVGDVCSTPALVTGKNLVAVSLGGNICVLDKELGTTLWSTKAGARIRTAPILFRGMLIICTDERNVLAYGPRRSP